MVKLKDMGWRRGASGSARVVEQRAKPVLLLLVPVSFSSRSETETLVNLTGGSPFLMLLCMHAFPSVSPAHSTAGGEGPREMAGGLGVLEPMRVSQSGSWSPRSSEDRKAPRQFLGVWAGSQSGPRWLGRDLQHVSAQPSPNGGLWAEL